MWCQDRSDSGQAYDSIDELGLIVMQSKVAMRLEPTIVKRRSLCGSSHDRCRCAEMPRVAQVAA
jgi:hypothetical protein